MVHCTDLNSPINVKTIGPLIRVTPAQTKPKFVWTIGNPRRDKLANQGGGECYIALWRMKFHWGTDWPFLVERGGVLKSFVTDCLYVENGKDVFLHGGKVGEQEFPFWIREFLAPQCFFSYSTGLYRNLYRLLWSCMPLGRWAAGPDCTFLRHWAVCM